MRTVPVAGALLLAVLLSACGAQSPNEGMVRYNDQWVTREEYVRLSGGQPEITTVPATTKPASTTKPVATTPAGIVIEAVELYKAYLENEVAADLTYDGKRLQVTGMVTRIGKDLYDNPTITFGMTSAMFGVKATFEKSRVSDVAAIKLGDQVTVIGTGDGKLVDVDLINCSVLKPTSTSSPAVASTTTAKTTTPAATTPAAATAPKAPKAVHDGPFAAAPAACTTCHTVGGAGAGAAGGMGMGTSHTGRANDTCKACHQLNAAK
jgi:hypothetical protein